MPNVGPLELLLLGLLAVVIFGPAKLPEIGRSLGKGMREFKDSVSGFTDAKDTLDGVNDVRTAMTPANLAGRFVPGVRDVQETVTAAKNIANPAAAAAAEAAAPETAAVAAKVPPPAP
jgi:sec-independent protein translocase protein TatA